MFNLGPMEVVVIALVALVILGPQRLPDAMRQAGRAVSELRRWSSSVEHQVRSAIDVEPAPRRPATVPDSAAPATAGPATAEAGG